MHAECYEAMEEPKNIKASVAKDKDGGMTHIFSTFEYDGFTACLEGGWDMPEAFPFTMKYNVNLEKAR